MNLLAALVDFILPPVCAACGVLSERPGLCLECSADLVELREPFCERCSVPLHSGGRSVCAGCEASPPAWDTARACFAYASTNGGPPVLASLIHRFKYGRDVTLAPLLGTLMLQQWTTREPYDFLLPVPLHLDRLRWRGFNQSLLLARAVGSGRGIRVEPAWLRRIRSAPRQVGLDDDARRHNVRGSMVVSGDADLRGKSVLLVDDVLTTGATAEECARVLRSAGATRVDVLVLARPPLHG